MTVVKFKQIQGFSSYAPDKHNGWTDVWTDGQGNAPVYAHPSGSLYNLKRKISWTVHKVHAKT
jgi:hypothetical protein